MEIKIRSDISEIKGLVSRIISSLESLELKEEAIFRVRLALEEAIVNAVKHGNKSNPNLAVTVNLSYEGNKIVLTVEDEGQGFDYKRVANPTDSKNSLKPFGRGIFLIRGIMDKVEFNEEGNKITMTKFF